MKKIFISHSSLDKDIVDIFIDKILILGLNLEVQDIACTSREDTGVKTGEDIREFIKENISNCDFVFFIISENYRNSQICLNEMGAAWATNRTVKPILFPNINFDSIGWLYNVRKGIMLDDSSALDSLYEDISEVCQCKSRISTWNKQKNEFLMNIRDRFKSNLNEKSLVNIEEEFDLLDWREKFDENIQIYLGCLTRITNALNKNTENTKKGTKVLNDLNLNRNTTSSQVRNILLKLANGNNILAEVYENECPQIEQAFKKAIEAAIKMREFSTADDENTAEDYESIKNLIKSMEESLESTKDFQESIESATSVKLDKDFSKSKKRLFKILDELINITQININKANELLFHLV